MTGFEQEIFSKGSHGSTNCATTSNNGGGIRTHNLLVISLLP